MQKERRFNVGDKFYIFSTDGDKTSKFTVTQINIGNYVIEYEDKSTYKVQIDEIDEIAISEEIYNSPLFQVMNELKSSSE